MNVYANYLAVAIPVAFAAGVRHVFSNWLDGKLRQRASRRHAVNNSMALRVTTFESAPWWVAPGVEK